MNLSDTEQKSIDENNLRILALERKIEKYNKKRLNKVMPVVMFGSEVVFGGSLIGLIFTSGVEMFVGICISGVVFVSSFNAYFKGVSKEQSWKKELSELKNENLYIKKEHANELMREAILSTDFSLVDNEAIDYASKDELKTALKVLKTKDDGIDELPLLPTTLQPENDLGDDVFVNSYYHTPKKLDRNSRN